jgi:hypothetical protein
MRKGSEAISLQHILTRVLSIGRETLNGTIVEPEIIETTRIKTPMKESLGAASSSMLYEILRPK